MTTLILSGKSGAGKDITAQFMKEKLVSEGKRVIVIHYADVLKFFLREYYEWDGQKDEYGRTLLQHVGTDQVRSVFPNYWVGTVVGFLAAVNDFDVAIIPDARFPNEIEVSMNTLEPSYCIRIERQNKDGSKWVNSQLTKEQQQHPSETSLDDYVFDYVIHNDEGLETLKESSYTVLRDIGLIEGE